MFRYGYVDFKTHEEAKKAVDRPVKIFGRSLNLDMASYKPDKTNGMRLYDTMCRCKCVDVVNNVRVNTSNVKLDWLVHSLLS